MLAMQGGPRLDKIARKWHDLAERRLMHFTELYRSGRWKRYYTREQFTLLMRDVIRSVKVWSELADRPCVKPPAARDDDLRTAA